MKKTIAGLLLTVFGVAAVPDDIRSDSAPDLAVHGGGNISLNQAEKSRANAMTAFGMAFLKPTFPAAVPDFLAALENDPDAELPLLMLLAGLDKKQNCDQVFAALVRIAENNPGALRLAQLSVNYLKDQNRPDEAVRMAENSMKAFDPETLTSRDLHLYCKLAGTLAKLYTELKKFDKGDELFENLLECDNLKNNFDLLCAAALFYSQAAPQSSNSAFFWFAESDREAFARKGNELLARLKNLAKENKQIIFLVGLYEDMNDPAGAEAILLEHLLVNPDDKVLQSELAQLLTRKKSPLALLYWRTIIKKHKLDPAYYLYLANAAMNERRLREAEDAFQWHLLANPGNQHTRLNLALLRQSRWELDKAMEVLEPARQTFPVLMYAGNVEYLQGKYDKAFETLTQAAEVAEKNKAEDQLPASFLVTMISLGEKRRDIKLVEKYAELWLKQYPDEFAAYANTLGYLLAENNAKLEKAQELIAEALKRGGNKTEYLDSMAWVLFKLKKYPEALKFMRDCLASDGEYPHAVIADHAGDIYNAVNDRENALKYWRLAMKTYEPELDREAIAQKIRTLENKK